ncbi:Lipase class 3 [Penicillium coprophilum]|uniref:Lipase class 3 n=1 Tax=Penicillium coprophilum TaxID=36646 RepID=UPI00238E9E18|nr:Lipase class 3 [Penicillium coprophilum]KAJ5171330.1 Lipase class 3 [Penicillium coprophilum]
MPRKRSYIKLSFNSLLLLTAALPDVASASGYYPPSQQVPIIPPQIPGNGAEATPDTHEFSLRHIFHRGTYDQPDLHARLDVKPDTRLRAVSEDGYEEQYIASENILPASSSPLTIQRLADRRLPVIQGHLTAARSSAFAAALTPLDWVMDTVPGPNITDKQTVLTFAQMTANDYIQEPGTGEWHTIHGQFNYSGSFGWQKDGLRGHIYSDKTNSTVVISLKGTSPALFDGAGTTTNDKVNDNLYFSCCCGQGGSYLWRQSCDCQSATFTANLTCIVESMTDENRYYQAAIDLYSNVTEIYPDANVWMTGHSLGGAMTSLVGLTFGLPVFQKHYPQLVLVSQARQGMTPRLPQSRKFTGAYHFGHTADPIYMGTCNGINSICTWGGYAMESACHTGQVCTYDTVADKGWRVGLGTHKIENVISDVILKYDSVPSCVAEEECFDCELWKFFRSNGSEVTTTTTTITTTSATRTSTCKTPGWWGCLDESTTATTTTTTTTSPTSTATTTTCMTPGWFGCNDPTTTATPAPTVTTTLPTVTATTSCHNPGWFGCRDETTTVATTTADSASPTSASCHSPGRVWGCWDESTNTPAITSAPTSTS